MHVYVILTQSKICSDYMAYIFLSEKNKFKSFSLKSLFFLYYISYLNVHLLASTSQKLKFASPGNFKVNLGQIICEEDFVCL